jgi:pimeloyl-ACP methyl ester carboxylesterase
LPTSVRHRRSPVSVIRGRCTAAGYDGLVTRPLFLVPGVGGDARLFAAQRIARDVRPVFWIEPRTHETLADYSKRLAESLATPDIFDIGGSSMGGMIALEMARHLSPQRVFLLGSCRTPKSIIPLIRHLQPLAGMAPRRMFDPPTFVLTAVARWFGAKSEAHVELFGDMLVHTPHDFIQWAMRAIVTWGGIENLSMPIHHIHGDEDHIIPIGNVQPERVVQGAGHLLTLTHAQAVNDFISAPEAAQFVPGANLKARA